MSHYYSRTNGNNNNNVARWASSRNFKLPEPKNPANQAAWDRLKAQYDKAKGENYERTLSRAIKSLAASKEAVTTFKEAMALKNVGQHCARIICPPNEENEATTVAKPARRTKKGASSSSSTMAPAPARVSKKTGSKTGTTSTTSVKEQAYQAAKQQATSNWSHPIQYSSRTDHANGLKWKVLLLVDSREPKCKHILSKCGMSGLPAEERTLPIGDMMWIAQGLRRHSVGGSITTTVEAELLLGTIIERKSTEDLVSSFMDKRYSEQRLRLQHSGQPQILFLIEGDINKEVNASFGKERMQMTLMETRVELGFQIIHTSHMTDTILTLKRFHRRILQRSFPDAFGIYDDALPTYNPELSRPQPSQGRRRQRRPTSLVEMVFDTPPTPALNATRFQTYEELKCKIERDREAGRRKVGAIHGAMLRQAGCGMKQVEAIQKQYPTPASLLKAYGMVDDNPQSMSALVKDCCIESANGMANRTVGPKISQDIYLAYCSAPEGLKRQSTTRESSNNMVAAAKSLRDSPTPGLDSTDVDSSDSNTRPTASKKRPRSEEEDMSSTSKRAPLAALKQPRRAPVASTFNPAQRNDQILKKPVAPVKRSTTVDLLSSDDERDTVLPAESKPRELGKKDKDAAAKLRFNSLVLLDDDSSDDDGSLETSVGNQAKHAAPGRQPTNHQPHDLQSSQSTVDSEDDDDDLFINAGRNLAAATAAAMRAGDTADDAIEIDQ